VPASAQAVRSLGKFAKRTPSRSLPRLIATALLRASGRSRPQGRADLIDRRPRLAAAIKTARRLGADHRSKAALVHSDGQNFKVIDLVGAGLERSFVGCGLDILAHWPKWLS